MLTSGFMTTTIALGMPGPAELLIILAIGLLVFGKRLPEVGRSLGKSIVEFKRGVRDIQNEIEEESSKPAQKPAQITAGEGVQAQGSKIASEPQAAEAVGSQPNPDAGGPASASA